MSGNFHEFWETLSFDVRCFFGASDIVAEVAVCSKSGALGGLFVLSYLVVYIFGTELTLYASANLGSVVGAVSPLLAAIFWFSFPSINAWAGGAPLTTTELGFNLGAFPAVIIGVLMYRYFEVEDKTPDSHEMKDGGVELCW